MERYFTLWNFVCIYIYSLQSMNHNFISTVWISLFCHHSKVIKLSKFKWVRSYCCPAILWCQHHRILPQWVSVQLSWCILALPGRERFQWQCMVLLYNHIPLWDEELSACSSWVTWMFYKKHVKGSDIMWWHCNQHKRALQDYFPLTKKTQSMFQSTCLLKTNLTHVHVICISEAMTWLFFKNKNLRVET